MTAALLIAYGLISMADFIRKAFADIKRSPFLDPGPADAPLRWSSHCIAAGSKLLRAEMELQAHRRACRFSTQHWLTHDICLKAN